MSHYFIRALSAIASFTAAYHWLESSRILHSAELSPYVWVLVGSMAIIAIVGIFGPAAREEN